MKRSYQTQRCPCEQASALGIPRECIWGHACRQCAFAQWLDDAAPILTVVSGSNKELERLPEAA